MNIKGKTMNISEKVKRDTTILWGIMCAIPIISLLLTFLVPKENQESIITMTLGEGAFKNEKAKDIFMYTFLVCSTVLAIVSTLIKKVIMSNSKIVNSDLSDDLKAQKWQASHIMSYGFLNSIPIFGFYLNGFGIKPLSYILTSISLILIFLFKPKID
jgi:hypothetical protein